MEMINPHNICSISVCKKLRNRQYQFKKRKTLLGFEIQREGFHDKYSLSEDFISEQLITELNSNVYIEGEHIYYKPHLDIFLANETMRTKIFNSEKELDDFLLESFFKDCPWIIINKK